MDQGNQLLSFNDAFSYLYSSSLGLVEQKQQFYDSEQQPIYQGMSVQVVNPFPICNTEPDTYQKEADHSNSLNEYDIESLTSLELENASEIGYQEIPQSILDQYVPYESDNEPVNDAFLLTPSTPFQQLILRNEPAISEQTPANHTSSVFQLPLTNFPAAPSSIEHLRPVAIVDPLYMHQNPSDNQSTLSEEIIDDNTPFFAPEREHYHEKMQDPEKRKQINQRKRERYHEKVQDPEKRKLINQRKRERYHEKVQDPEKRKLINQRERERLADPEKRKLKNQRERERRADPEKRKLRNQRRRERYHEKVQDPEKRKLINQRQRERLADPEKRKLINQRQRERRADPEKRKLRNQRERERRADPEKRKLINQRKRERRADPEKRKLRNQRQQALPAISPSGDISQLSYITEATPTSSTN